MSDGSITDQQERSGVKLDIELVQSINQVGGRCCLVEDLCERTQFILSSDCRAQAKGNILASFVSSLIIV